MGTSRERWISSLGDSLRLARRGATVRQIRECRRLIALPRREPGTSDLLGLARPVSFLDATSLVSGWTAIHLDGIYDLPARTSSPRILDLGANIGLASIRWLEDFPTARITAFEADPATAEALQANLHDTGIEVITAAVGSHDGTTTFVPDRSDAGRVGDGPGSIEVATVRLGPWLADPVDLLKVDIEGGELELFEDVADQLGQVERVFVEYHGFADAPRRLHRLLELLTDSGLRYWLQHEWSPMNPFVSAPTDQGMDLRVNVHAVRPRSVAR